MVILNKIDIAFEEEQIAELARIKTAIEAQGLEVFSISAAGFQGLVPLKERLYDLVSEERQKSEIANTLRSPWAKGLKPAASAGVPEGCLIDFMAALQNGNALSASMASGCVH